MKTEITTRQREVLEAIIDFKTNFGMPPTLAELASKLNLKNRSTIQQHLNALQKKGYILRNSNLARGLSINIDEKIFSPKPILGEVAAGNPLTIYPDSIDTIDLPSVAYMPHESFLLKVKGNSLKDAYIFSGDVVIVNPNLTPKNGQIVVAVLDDAAVVKRFYIIKNNIELRSENPEYETITISKNHFGFKLVGVVIGVYRSFQKKVING